MQRDESSSSNDRDRRSGFHHKAQNLNQIIDCMASSVNKATTWSNTAATSNNKISTSSSKQSPFNMIDSTESSASGVSLSPFPSLSPLSASDLMIPTNHKSSKQHQQQQLSLVSPLDVRFNSMMNNLNLAAQARASAWSSNEQQQQQAQRSLYHFLSTASGGNNNREDLSRHQLPLFAATSFGQGQVLLLPADPRLYTSAATATAATPSNLLNGPQITNTNRLLTTIAPKNNNQANKKYKPKLSMPVSVDANGQRRGRGRPRLVQNQPLVPRVGIHEEIQRRKEPMPIKPKLSTSSTATSSISPLISSSSSSSSNTLLFQPQLFHQNIKSLDDDHHQFKVPESPKSLIKTTNEYREMDDGLRTNDVTQSSVLLERNHSQKTDVAVLTHLVDDFVVKESSVPFEQLGEQDINDKSNICLFCGRSSNRNENFCSSECAGLFEQRKYNFLKSSQSKIQTKQSPTTTGATTSTKTLKAGFNPQKKHKIEKNLQDVRATVVAKPFPIGLSAASVTSTTTPRPFPVGDPTEWSCEQVFQFVCRVADQSIAQVFKDQDLDGAALSLIKDDHLVHTMQIKLGPALKIMSKFNELRRSFTTTTAAASS